jgi:DNA-directed RNA polymerase subunit H (RpoH/RPB5)
LEARSDHQLKQEQLGEKELEMMKQIQEFQERGELLQHKIAIDTKNLSKEEKKEVISQLEVHRKELSKQIEELKAKELQVNRQRQDLKKKER